jgi:divalent metal cation (Fe/Co/Zn/Cd) transporter
MTVAISVDPGLRDRARMAQLLTITWMVVEGLVAVVAGVAAHSVALTAFGTDSAIEVFTAAVVLHQLMRRSELGADLLDAGERRASRLVGIALYAVAAYIAVTSAVTLLAGVHPEPSTPGVVLACASVLIMPVLWRWRLGLSERLHSAALRADAACSAVCLYMAVTLLVGLALNRLFGWWWADTVAALAMTWWIVGEAREALEAADTGTHCADCA